MTDPNDILERAYQQATHQLDQAFALDEASQTYLNTVARNLKNRAGVRLLMACLLAKIDQPHVDVRKPYTEIGDDDVFSGRRYDESYITPFKNKYQLPCNDTTAFLTPALRNRNVTLTEDINLVGRPPHLYKAVLHLLSAVHHRHVEAETLLVETIRQLLLLKQERQNRITSLLGNLKTTHGSLPLSSII